jgi:hypothetical protein
MKQADLKTDGTKYRRQGDVHPVVVIQTGVKRYSGMSQRRDGVVIKALSGPHAEREIKLYSKEIIREWNENDEANLQRAQRAATATSRARIAMAQAGFENPAVRVSVREHQGQVIEIPHITLMGDDAEKLLAMIAQEDET